MIVLDMVSVEDILAGDGDVDFDKDFTELDTNEDGDITMDDCPFEHGSERAKLWWKKVQAPYVKTQVTEDLATKYGDKVVGVYKGKPLVPGEAGRGQGDFGYLVDKLQVTRGLTPGAATKIAGKIKWTMYGG
jgi:hypothetical protein